MIVTITTVGGCHCEARQDAQRNARFLFNAFYRGFVFSIDEGTPRRKDGSPFVWLDCPYCGGDLLNRNPD